MPDRITRDDLTLTHILSDAPSLILERIRDASGALIDAVGPASDEFSDPEFVETTLLPLMYERYLAWLSFGEKVDDEDVAVVRFCENVRNYARNMRRRGTFKRFQPSQYFVEVTFEQHISLFGSRYSSVPPATAEGEVAIPYGPPTSVETDPVLRYMSDEMIELAQELMVSLVRLANSDLGCSASKEYVENLLEAFETLKQDRSRTLAPFLQLLFQNETRVHLRAFMYRFENWFFGTFVEALSEYQSRGSELIDGGSVAAFTKISDGINAQYERGIDYLGFIKGVRGGLDSILNKTEVGRPYRADWAGYLMRSRTLSHDYGNALMSLLHASSDIRRIAEGRDAKPLMSVLESLMRPFDASSVISIIDMVLRMTGKEADRVGISMERRHMDDIVVPYDYRAPLFRIVHELVRNAIKYRDDEKQNRFIKVDSRRGKDELVISIMDNGVGIEDTDEAIKWGYRERPDLAVGTGVGLANIDSLARECGWRFEIQSQHGACTRAKVFMGITDWSSPAPGSAGGSGELGGDPSDTSVAGAMSAANLASTQFSSAVAVGARAFLCAGLA